jgi:hypothetical protein
MERNKEMSLEYKVDYDDYATIEDAVAEASREAMRRGRDVTIYQAYKTVKPNDPVIQSMTTIVDWVAPTPQE